MAIDQFLRTFLSESQENLDTAEAALLRLEQHPSDADAIDTLYRAMHTIKGGAGFFSLENLQKLVHAAETLLGKMRDQAIAVNGETIGALLKTVDTARQSLRHMEQTNKEPYGYADELTSFLASFVAQEPVNSPAPFGIFDDNPPEPTPPHHPTSTDSTVRVNTSNINQLMNLVGELVLRRNEVLNLTTRQGTPALTSACQRLSRITSDLQESVMRLRMQPIATIWNQYPRILRDLALDCGKSVKLRMEGQETELDKTILEAVKDPLIHLVRNAVDHGIEPPEERVSAGKSAEGNFTLRACQQHGQVILEISDDGRGLDLEKIKKKAVDRELISSQQVGSLTDKDASNLIFLPGLSTASTVTNISGRGVGMDVVKSGIERVGGTIDIETRKGEGTCFRIKIPLTLAIIPALMVRSGQNSFAVPTTNLLEVLRHRDGGTTLRMERLNNHSVMRLRGDLMPVVHLRELLTQGEGDHLGTDFYVLVLQANGLTFGLAVEGVEDIEEIVVKPLMPSLQDVSSYSGVTLKSDGSVTLILDIQTLSQQAAFMHQKSVEQAGEPLTTAALKTPLKHLLLVQGRDNLIVAIPIENVARLERVVPRQLELTAEGIVVQYRRSIIPLVRVDEFLGAEADVSQEFWKKDEIPLVIHRVGDADVGIAVDAIIDIVEAEAAILRTSSKPYVAGSTVIRNRVTEILDMEAVYATLGATKERPHA